MWKFTTELSRNSAIILYSPLSSYRLRRTCLGRTSIRWRSGGVQNYKDAYEKSIKNPEEYWGEAAEHLVWFKKFTKVYEQQSYPRTKWFKGGELNLCYNAVDRHVDEGNGDLVALIHDSPVTQSITKLTYRELQLKVTKLAAQLVSMGVEKGDRVLIYMPMIPEATMGMLACARIGAPHCVVFGGFAAKELATRIAHVQPKVILSANCGIETTRVVWYKPILDEAIKLADIEMEIQTLIYQREGFTPAKLTSWRDFDWVESVEKRSRGIDCVSLSSDHPLYIIHTSGTTGMPKGILRSTGGHGVVLPWSLKHIFGMKRGETWWAASDLGWVVGHSYICYGPLLLGLTSVIYEGKPVGTPDAGQFYRVIHQHGVNAMFTAPTALRAIRREDPENLQASDFSRKSLRTLFVAGEHCDNETRQWAQKSFKVPVIDNWWQTETGHPITSTCVGLGCNPNAPIGSSGFPLPGYQLEILRENGRPAGKGQFGRIVCKLPLPPGFMDTLYKSDDLFISAYFSQFQGYYDTMDAGYKDENGHVYVMARVDDVINVAGHRISTAALEEAVLEHPEINDAAVIGVPDNAKGHVPLALYVKRPGSTVSDNEIEKGLVQLVRNTVGPVASFKLAASVITLPRTRSGKTPRKTISLMAESKPVKIPATIEDPNVYDDIQRALKKLGFAKDSTFEK